MRVVLPLALLTMPSVAHADQEPRVEWNDQAWRRAGWQEGMLSVGLTASLLALDAVPYPSHPSWHDSNGFDTDARGLFKAQSQPTLTFASTASDYLFVGMVAAPFVVDDYFVALSVHQNADVAVQMTVMDLESFGIAGALTLGAEHLVGRARPPFTDCGDAGTSAADPGCQRRDDYRSFYAGHPAAAFTSAGLTCAHHQHLPLYGGGLPDVLACVGMVGLATTTSVLRLVADRHWASDVLVGAAVGVGSGYFLPSLLHYGMFGAGRTGTAVKTSFGYVAPMPVALERGAGLGLVGVF